MPSSAVRISFAGLSALLLASPIASVARTISWGGCDPSIVTDPSLQCGFLDVPLDYHDAGVGNARLALVKANATGERRGTVFFNPGGPGESGLENLNLLKDALLWRTGGVYDVVSWDPRGVGLSIPGHTRCFDSLEEYEAFFNGTLEANGLEYTGNFTDPADIQALLSQAPMMQEKYKELAQRCLDSPNGRYFRYLGTAATVRDLVSIADVIEGPDAPINYYGISYGTLLGAWFVNMFPDRVGRVVVDGVLDPVSFATLELPSGDWATQQYESADANYKGFITGCALAGPEGCAIASEGDGPLEINAKVQSLLKAAYHATRANASFPLTSGLIRARDLFPPMYAPWRWQNLANTVYPQDLAILEGNFSVPDPGLGGIDLLKYSIRTIICADSVDQSPLTNMTNIFEGMIEVAQTTTALFGGIWPNVGTQCSFWPVRSVERYQGPFNRKLANKILVASTTYDNITPLASAQRLAGLLGEDASLVELRSFGHTTLIAAPSTCLTDIMVAYMVNGTVPANNTLCEVDADFEPFKGVNTEAIFDKINIAWPLSLSHVSSIIVFICIFIPHGHTPLQPARSCHSSLSRADKPLLMI